MTRIFLVLLLLGLVVSANAQSDTGIVITQQGNKFVFQAKLPPLQQIPGAPKPFYSYLWDFGDGHFSTEANPAHVYENPGTYEATLYAVNNYDDGKKPGKRTQKVPVLLAADTKGAPSPAEAGFFKANGVFELKYDCMARPGDTMVVIAGIKSSGSVRGNLLLFLNEKYFGRSCFDTAGFRWYHPAEVMQGKELLAALRSPEKILFTSSGSPAANTREIRTFTGTDGKAFLTSLQKSYEMLWGMCINSDAPASNFIFSELRVTPEMLQDTGATITITGLFVPDTGMVYLHQLQIPIVTSHDPNKMTIQNSPLNYRLLSKQKKLSYKIRFQNDGDGPARRIRLAIDLPEEANRNSISIKDMKPQCPPCDSLAVKRGCWQLVPDSANPQKVYFDFNSIYVAGTNQRGVADMDSTKGFLQFEVSTKKKLNNAPFRGRTAIYFDNNPPVITNFATGRFKPSLSPIVFAGWYHQIQKPVSNGVNVGVGISKLAPHKPYLQFEFWGSVTQTRFQKDTFPQQGRIVIENTQYEYRGFSQIRSQKIIQAGVVPVHLRHNINNWLSAGAGARVDAVIQQRDYDETTYRLLFFGGQQNVPYTIKTNMVQKNALQMQVLPFVDVQAGKVKLGPQLGARYYLHTAGRSFIFLYASVRL